MADRSYTSCRPSLHAKQLRPHNLLSALSGARCHLWEVMPSSHLGGPVPPLWKMPANFSGSNCCLTTSCTHTEIRDALCLHTQPQPQPQQLTATSWNSLLDAVGCALLWSSSSIQDTSKPTMCA